MGKDAFSKRLTELRLAKNVSARDMSLSLGQSHGYINNIENGGNYPPMTIFFCICDYSGIMPGEFSVVENKDPVKTRGCCRR
jgi:transcriptional regulator with XRE-family HTH domain